MLQRDAKTGRRAIVKDVDCEVLEPDHLGEAINHLGDVIERVGECVPRRHVGLAEAGQIGSHDAKAIGEKRDDVPKHVTRTREAVEQQQRRRVCGARLAIEDVESVHVDFSISDSGHDSPPGCNLFGLWIVVMTSGSGASSRSTIALRPRLAPLRE
jgi:hypothetical protein